MATGVFKDKCFITAGRAFAVILKTAGMDSRSRIILLKDFVEECESINNEKMMK
jgi:hypothetical protein